MREIKELLELMLDDYKAGGNNISSLYDVDAMGLCHVVYYLVEIGRITEDETDIIRHYMHNNVPVETFYDHNGNIVEDSNQFWYPAGEKEPRIAWLEEHIKLNDNV